MEMSMDDWIREMVGRMVEEMRGKAREMPEVGDFGPVFAEFKIPDRSMFITDTGQGRTDSEMSLKDRRLCMTDVMLRLESLPKHLAEHETMRWLSVVGYKLPAPYKSTIVIRRGNKEDILRYLNTQDVIDKILERIHRLDWILQDI